MPHSKRKLETRFLHVFVLTTLLAGCLGSDPKRIGDLSSINKKNTPTDATDTFVLEFALRDTLSGTATNRSVVIQGRSTGSTSLLVDICGADAAKCSCQFFTSSNTITPILATVQTINSELNTITCQIPASVLDADLASIAFIRIIDSSGKINSGQLRIENQVKLADVLGVLSQGSIRKIYGYSCTRQFLEGSGISNGVIECKDGMQLATLRADYAFYLYQQVDQSASNFSQRGQDQFYTGQNGTLCGLQIQRVTCSAGNTLKYGLPALKSDKFTVAITLTSGPEPTGLPGFFGFAAKADSTLTCPPGLVKIRPFQAMPSTYIPAAGIFSNFVNSDGKLNDTQLELASASIANFKLRRTGPDTSQSCLNQICHLPNGTLTDVEDIAYDTLSPVLCAIPVELLNGI